MIDRSWVDYWTVRYSVAYDQEMFDTVGPRVHDRGCFDRPDLLEVGRWKSRRVLPLLESNSDDDIAAITFTSFNAPEPIRHRILTLLRGVQVPMASAMLTVWNPDLYTVIDVRAVASLRAADELPAGPGLPRYVDYLTLCRTLVDRCECSLRTLDRALYAANGRTPGTRTGIDPI